MDIAAWLQGLGLGQYEQVFQENDVDPAVLSELTAEDLNALGVRSVGHRRKLLAAIAALQAERITAPRATGARLALPGEMKQVSVLFCDIVNSTPLAERLGAEAMRDLMHGFLEASLTEVRRYGGSAPHFTGDGFMALFGAPVAHEDHARRALLAALAIEQANTDHEGMELSLRIGLHTGPVVFGPVADNLPTDTVIGDTANVAARLQQAAEPGTILISEATRLLARGYARVEPVGPLILKGKVEPILAYRLLDMSHRHRAELDEAPSSRAADFVDRQSELATLNDFLRQVENGGGQAVGLVGEPGIGKSRVLAEFRRQLGDGRVTWVEGRCLSYGTAIPYLLALDLLRSNCGIAESDARETVRRKLRAGLRQVEMNPDDDGLALLDLLEIEDAVSPALSNPEAVKRKAFETLRQLMVKRSLQRPLILVLEDLH
jgi:class 3 adenylate cyclase